MLLIIPPNTPHYFSKVESDKIVYLVTRVDFHHVLSMRAEDSAAAPAAGKAEEGKKCREVRPGLCCCFYFQWPGYELQTIRSEKLVSGHYELQSRDLRILLDVVTDHSYVETVEFTSGARQTQTGSWKFTDNRVCFNDFLEPESIMKNLMQNLPPEARPTAYGGLYQRDDCLPASQIYGKLLEIDPDNSDNFVKVSATTNRQ